MPVNDGKAGVKAEGILEVERDAIYWKAELKKLLSKYQSHVTYFIFVLY